VHDLDLTDSSFNKDEVRQFAGMSFFRPTLMSVSFLNPIQSVYHCKKAGTANEKSCKDTSQNVKNDKEYK
jgi:ABC-type phosphate transport system ATPase subunit